jgi:hypothetical protein
MATLAADLGVRPTTEASSKARVTPTDVEELDRLSEQLRLIDAELDSNPSGREALQKAGIALIITFLHGRRQELEEWYQSIDAPPTDAQRAHLRRLGIGSKTDG